MKSILIPTDFSKNSKETLLYTVQTFGHIPRRFIALYSYEQEMSALTSRVNIGKTEKMTNILRNKAEEEGKALLNWLENKLGPHNHTIDFISTSLHIYRAVNKLIKDHDVVLVAMGTKGQTASENVLVGSTTVKMIERIQDCPLLVIPSYLENEVSTKMAFATDLEQFVSLSSIEPLRELSKFNKATLDVVHVGKKEKLNETQKTNLLVYEDDLKGFDTTYHYLEKKSNVANTLQIHLDEHGIDFLILIYRKHNVIRKLFREPVINHLGRKMSMPHLILPK